MVEKRSLLSEGMSIEVLTDILMDVSEGEAWIRFKPKKTLNALGVEVADAIETILGEAGRRSQAPYELGDRVPLDEMRRVLCWAIAESLLGDQKTDRGRA